MSIFKFLLKICQIQVLSAEDDFAMLDQELIKKIKKIQIYTSHAVNASFAGQYESVFRGRGMQFEEVREYTPGDDVRDIDWNVTARAGKPYIKRYREEREMTVLLAVDMSGSGDFGTVGKSKNELAAELCAVLAFAAIRNNDKVGLLIFTDEIELYIPPKKGSGHVLRMIRELLCFEVRGKKTDISSALDYVARVTNKRATIFLVSDFLDKDYGKKLGLVRRRHDLIAVKVRDGAEVSLPGAGIVELVDPESGERVTVDMGSKKVREHFEGLMRAQKEAFEGLLRSHKVDSFTIQTGRPYINDIVKFFHMRHGRR